MSNECFGKLQWEYLTIRADQSQPLELKKSSHVNVLCDKLVMRVRYEARIKVSEVDVKREAWVSDAACDIPKAAD